MDLRGALIHELANKVSALKSMTELKEDCLGADLLLTIDNIDLLVRYMLDVEISKSYEERRSKSTDVGRVLEDVISELNLFLKLRGVRVDMDGCSSVEVFTDEFLLRRVLYNLLHNAVKFSPAGGKVSVRCHLAEGRIAISIQNDVDPQMKESWKGSGIGLKVTKGLANHLGADVTLEVESNRAKAEVLLPVN